MPFASLLKTYQVRTERALARRLPTEGTLPERLHRAMRYMVLDGGKRIRPILVYATGVALGVPLNKLDGPACAMELIHVYSLVHDDLPSMDNDVLRRGKPTCHMAFDEATAILTGDALQSLAFHLLAHDPSMISNPVNRLQMVETLAHASGSRGMASGQAIDLDAVGQQLNLLELENMHIHKTGALFRASVKLGALCQERLSSAMVSENVLEKLDHYAKCIGLAFQIRDDILDVEANTETLGKTQGSDLARNKPTYTSLVGLEEAKKMAENLRKEAIDSLDVLGASGEHLAWIGEYIINRQH